MNLLIGFDCDKILHQLKCLSLSPKYIIRGHEQAIALTDRILEQSRLISANLGFYFCYLIFRVF